MLGAFDAAAQRRCRRLEHLGRVGHDERAQGGAADGGHFERQGFGKHTHVAAMQGIHAEDTAEGDDVTNKYKHGGDFVRLNVDQRKELV